MSTWIIFLMVADAIPSIGEISGVMAISRLALSARSYEVSPTARVDFVELLFTTLIRAGVIWKFDPGGIPGKRRSDLQVYSASIQPIGWLMHIFSEQQIGSGQKIGDRLTGPTPVYGSGVPVETIAVRPKQSRTMISGRQTKSMFRHRRSCRVKFEPAHTYILFCL